jgi:hypothetical protein
MTELPEDPLEMMQIGAAQLHSMFVSFVAAGFTEQQALELTKCVMSSQVSN